MIEHAGFPSSYKDLANALASYRLAHPKTKTIGFLPTENILNILSIELNDIAVDMLFSDTYDSIIDKIKDIKKLKNNQLLEVGTFSACSFYTSPNFNNFILGEAV